MPSSLTTEILDLIAAGRLAEATDRVIFESNQRPDDPETICLGAMVLWKGNDRESARSTLQDLLARSPGEEDALRILGALQMEASDAQAAALTLQQLCGLPGARIPDWLLWAETLIAEGRYRTAARILEDLLPKAKDFPDVRLHLANVYLGEDRSDEALILLDEARQDSPDNLQILAALARLYACSGRRTEGLLAMKHLTELSPQNATAWLELAKFHFWSNEYPETVIALSKALELAPDDPDIHYNIGDLYIRLKAYHLAEQHYQRVIELAPQRRDDAESAMAIARFNRGDADDAEACLKAMLARDPHSFSARRGLIFVYDHTHQHEKALEYLDELLMHSDGNSRIRFNHALSLLRLGRFKEGWGEWEHRFKTGLRAIESDQPYWKGELIPDKRLLVIWEQGFGDSIQFVRFLPLLRQYAGHITLICQVGLKQLIERSNLADKVIELPLKHGDLPEHDYAVALMSLPHILGIDLDNLPAHVPYLVPDPTLVARWRERMNTGPEFRVGLVWSGSPTHSNDPNRSCPTDKLKLLADIPGVRYFSLLRGPDVAQLEQLRNDLTIEEYGSQFASFDDTAAALMNIDLLISVDTSVAHLGGALAIPVWLLLPICPDWRWLTGRESSPWYPSLKLFRQDNYQDWDGVLERVSTALRELVGRQTR